MAIQLRFLKIRFLNSLCGSDMFETRLILSLSSIMVGIFLIINNMIGGAPCFMSSIMPTSIWGVIFLFHGIFSLFSLMLNLENVANLVISGFLGCFIWSFLTLSSIIFSCSNGHLFPVSIIPEIILTVVSWWSMVRLWADTAIPSMSFQER